MNQMVLSMNKKFTSAILLGALLTASASSFVSCKDYDDDIDDINKELAQVKSRVSAIEAEIEKGEWITDVKSVANGFTVTFSNGQSYTITNGKDGANGADGADGADGANGNNGENGTAWTISEDGYWVCDDVKTDYKAIGEDGKAGADGTKAQPEVKKENGIWYLWNGTEYVALTSAFARAEAIPYYYIDPNDQNYAVMVITDVNGNAAQTVRLPLNEGLAQLNFVKESSKLEVWYTAVTQSTAWEGPKGNLVAGTYMMTQNASSIIVQVTPTNYDLAAIEKFSLVNSKNEVAPIEVGTPKAYTDLLLATREVSSSGLFELPVKATSIDADMITKYAGENVALLSLKANDKVRSQYAFKYTVNATKDNSGKTVEAVASGIASIKFTKVDPKATKVVVLKNDGPGATKQPDEGEEQGNTGTQLYTVEMGDSLMFEASTGAKFVYDAYLAKGKLTTEQEAQFTAWGITFDQNKLMIKANDKANGVLPFKIVYMDITGGRAEVPFYVDFTKTTITTFNNLFDKAIEHNATGVKDNQCFTADLTKYFSTMSTEDRAHWNDNAHMTCDSVTWVKNDGTKLVLSPEVVFSDTEYDGKDGIATGDLSEFVKLKTTFVENYEGIELGNGKFFAYISFKDGTERGSVDIIKIPFIVNAPTTEDIQAQYSFNTNYMKDNTLTATASSIKLPADDNTIYIYGASGHAADIDFSQAQWNGISFSEGSISITKDDDYGKSCQVTGAKLNYIGRKWDITNLYLKFEKSEEDQKYIIFTTFDGKLSIKSGYTNNKANELKITNSPNFNPGWYVKEKEKINQMPCVSTYKWTKSLQGKCNFKDYVEYFTVTVPEDKKDLIKVKTKKDYNDETNTIDNSNVPTGTIIIESTSQTVTEDTDVTLTITYTNPDDNKTATKDIVITVTR